MNPLKLLNNNMIGSSKTERVRARAEREGRPSFIPLKMSSRLSNRRMKGSNLFSKIKTGESKILPLLLQSKHWHRLSVLEVALADTNHSKCTYLTQLVILSRIVVHQSSRKPKNPLLGRFWEWWPLLNKMLTLYSREMIHQTQIQTKTWQLGFCIGPFHVYHQLFNNPFNQMRLTLIIEIRFTQIRHPQAQLRFQ